MKNLWLSVACIFCFSIALFAGDIDLIESDRSGVTLQWTLDSYTVNTTEQYSSVEFAGGSGLYAVGSPNLPSQQTFIEAPMDAQIVINIENPVVETTTVEKPIAPAQEPDVDTVGAEQVLTRNFAINREAYASTEAFPSQVVEVAYDGIMRGRRLILVRINPIQYVAATGELRVHKSLRANIEFRGATRSIADTDNAMDPIARALIKNYQPARQQSRGGAECLIITPADLQENAQQLAAWKNQKGTKAKVEVIGNNVVESNVKDIIKANYPSVKFVMIVGDHPRIPLSTQKASRHPMGKERLDLLGIGDAAVPSDLYYTCLEGDDYYPDVYLGRIPANNKEEADVLIGKLLKYQKNPATGDFMKRFLLCGEFQYQYRQKNTAERLFCETAFTIWNSLNDRYDFPAETIGTGSYGLGHTQYFFRTAKDENDPLRPGTYRSKIRDAEGPVKNCEMPAHWTKNIVSNSQATNNTLDYWEKGAFLVQHRDHGSYTSWGKPAVRDSDVANLTNGDKLPILFSINCLTGGMDQSRDCFVEAALKNKNGGAAAAIGSTRVSYSWWNDRLCDGFYTCLFGSDYDCLDTGVKLPKAHTFSKQLGVVLNFGKMYLALNYPSNPFGTKYDYTETEFYLFQCIGDPEMQIWTGNPTKMDVSTATTRNGLSVSVTNAQNRAAVNNAQVCLYGEGQQIVLQTENGKCSFPSNLTGTFTLTVTGSDLYPYQTTITLK